MVAVEAERMARDVAKAETLTHSNDCVLLQHVYEGSDYAHLLEVTFLRHLRYARVHEMDYVVAMSDKSSGGDWSKVRMIREALRKYTYVVWMDADAVIMNVDFDLRRPVAPKNIGIAGVNYKNPGPHINCGVLYFRRCKETLAFVDDWWAARPGNEPWYEQGVFNDLTRSHPEAVGEVTPRLNANSLICPSEDPIVLAWHGWPNCLGSSLTIVREQMVKAQEQWRHPNALGV